MARWTLLVCSFCWWTTSLFSEGLSEKLSYSEFEQLVRQKVAEIPEMKTYWSNASHEPVNRETYLAGGLLRGLLHWLHSELKRQTDVEAVRRLSPPSLQQLALQEWSDWDMVVPDGRKPWAKARLPDVGGYWDTLEQVFIKDSIRSGGAAIEKLHVNPWEIKDHYSALFDYYHGKQRLIVNDNPNVGSVVGNTHLAQALRFLRFTKNLPEAEAEPVDWENVERIVGEEWDTIRRGGKEDYWVIKGIRKLYHAHGRDPLATVRALKKSGLLRALGRHHFSLHEEESIDIERVNQILRNPRAFNLSLDDALNMAELFGRNSSERLQFLSTLESNQTSEIGKSKIAERKSIIRHIGEKYAGLGNIRPQLNANINILGKEIQVPLQVNVPAGAQVAFGQAGPPRAAQGGGVVFDVPLVVNGNPQHGACLQLHVRLGAPQLKIGN